MLNPQTQQIRIRLYVIHCSDTNFVFQYFFFM